MKILLTAATPQELQFIDSADNVTVADTGTGIASTVYNLTKLLSRDRYDLVLNIGIAGSFSEKLSVGQVVTVCSEIFGDFGVAAQNGFFTCFEENIISADTFPFKNGILMSENAEKVARDLSATPVRGVTNNTVSGEETLIKRMKDKFSPDIETMEGAAFFYVCLREHLPFAEIRSISNMVEPRDKSRWNIPLAIKNLSDKINSYLANI
ncbi:MAG: futalosine hydrolase [Prevotellaceae bacterium]|jgi:futalosine hydrolase|nr:futalosine hydrolase [Prevotellaceae bacterium]